MSENSRHSVTVVLVAVAGILLAGLFRPVSAQYEVADSVDIDAYFDRPYSPEYEQRMVRRIAGQINRYFADYTDVVVDERATYWNRDFSSWSAYAASVAPNRKRLRTLIGAVDDRSGPAMETYGTVSGAGRSDVGLLVDGEHVHVRRVRWPVLDGIRGEGLLLTPSGDIRARVVAYPDVGQSPEDLANAWAGGLVERGIQVVIPTLINRETTYSGSDSLIPQGYWNTAPESLTTKFTNEPHREWVYRHAYPMGRHIIGYEVQKGLAAVDWFESRGQQPVGVVGYGEGGLLAFYAAAIDDRIEASLVSGYFGPRETLWQEPIYRNVWGLLKQFGDAEIASLIAPRSLVIEYSQVPDVDGPPPPKGEGRGSSAAAPGRLWTPDMDAVRAEVSRLDSLFTGDLRPDVTLITGEGGSTTGPGSADAVSAFTGALGAASVVVDAAPLEVESGVDESLRQHRQIEQITGHLKRTMHERSALRRYRLIEGDLASPEVWKRSMEPYREKMYREMIGRLDEEPVPPNAERRKVFAREEWTGYEIVMDILPGVKGWGLLALPNDLEENEQRPVVVVQHGHAGIPTTPLRIDSYNRILPKLVERGFIVYAPHNPYQFNPRRAAPVKATVFSVLIPQHQQIARWLQDLPNVDDDRIGFYGKSWGGRSALRIPPYVPEYRLSICSAFFNDWSRKTLSTQFYHSILYNGSIGLYEWNQLNTFTHAEMAQLIIPRPFMVENGYYDGVKPDEWAGYEFAKVKRVYQKLGITDRAVFGTHIGGHEVHADTILPFLHEHLNWPVPATD